MTQLQVLKGINFYAITQNDTIWRAFSGFKDNTLLNIFLISNDHKTFMRVYNLHLFRKWLNTNCAYIFIH